MVVKPGCPRRMAIGAQKATTTAGARRSAVRVATTATATDTSQRHSMMPGPPSPSASA